MRFELQTVGEGDFEHLRYRGEGTHGRHYTIEIERGSLRLYERRGEGMMQRFRLLWEAREQPGKLRALMRFAALWDADPDLAMEDTP